MIKRSKSEGGIPPSKEFSVPPNLLEPRRARNKRTAAPESWMTTQLVLTLRVDSSATVSVKNAIGC